MYADLGYNVNPFRIDYPFSAQQSSLAYKNNFSPFLGLGFAYKWFHLRVGFPVIGNLRPADKFGKTTLLLGKPPGCLCTPTSFITERSFRGLSW